MVDPPASLVAPVAAPAGRPWEAQTGPGARRFRDAEYARKAGRRLVASPRNRPCARDGAGDPVAGRAALGALRADRCRCRRDRPAQPPGPGPATGRAGAAAGLLPGASTCELAAAGSERGRAGLTGAWPAAFAAGASIEVGRAAGPGETAGGDATAGLERAQARALAGASAGRRLSAQLPDSLDCGRIETREVARLDFKAPVLNPLQ